MICSRSALLTTETELRLIANAAIIGDNSQPVNGNSTPSCTLASGMSASLPSGGTRRAVLGDSPSSDLIAAEV